MARLSQPQYACHSIRLSDYLNKVTELLKNDPSGEFRSAQAAFTRGGPLSPELLVTLLLHQASDAGRRGYQHLLDAFWDEARAFGLSLPTEEPVSAAAFCKARYKLQPELIRQLLRRAAGDFGQHFGRDHLWHGHRVFAVDGSWMSTRRSDWNWLAFGGADRANNPQMLVCTLFQLFSQIPHDVVIGRFDSNEREQLLTLLDGLHAGDVLVLDRGYPSYALFCELRARGIHFVVRMPSRSTFAEVERFARGGARDSRIVLEDRKPGSGDRPASLTLRAVAASRGDSADVILLTDLKDRAVTVGQLDKLYQRRWQVEEFYKLEKGDYLGQGQFHALYPNGVRQEVLALALSMALTRLLMAHAAAVTGTPYDELSQKAAVLAVAAYLTRLLLESASSSPDQDLAALLVRIARHRIPRRPGRSHPRRSYRPRPRWNSFGKSGG